MGPRASLEVYEERKIYFTHRELNSRQPTLYRVSIMSALLSTDMEKGKGLALLTFKPGAFQPLSSHNNAYVTSGPDYKLEQYITAFWKSKLKTALHAARIPNFPYKLKQ
jgi:hypothetical protein